MKRSVSSNASKNRTAWFFIVVKIGDQFEVNLGWKYWDGTVGFYSDAHKNSPAKPPWGRVVSCTFNQTTNRKGELGDYFKFENEDGKKFNFNADLMNVMVVGVNDFTQKIAAMRTGKQEVMLARFLSQLTVSEGFSHHNPEIHTSYGELRNETLGQYHLSREELEDFANFVKCAKEAAFVVEKKSEVFGQIAATGGQKIKQTSTGNDEGSSDSKKGRMEKVLDIKENEIADENGIEKSFKSKYFGRTDVKLDNLSLSDRIAIPINQIKVLGIANAMSKRFDPSLLNFTVYPSDQGHFDANNLEKNEYKIIHGVHRFKALKILERKGELVKLPYMENKLVTCFIVNVQNSADIVYGNLRGNDLASKFQRHPYIHELVFIYASFKQMNDNSFKALDLIVRFAKLLLAHPDEITALKKIAGWTEDSFDSLVSVLEKFELYETKDCAENIDRIKGRLCRGEKMKVTKEMFILIGKCDQEYFRQNAPKVICKEMSLKCLVEGVKKVMETHKTMKLVTTLTKYQSHQELQEKFPDKFSQEKLEMFVGAEVKNKTANQKGELLKKYCESVLENKLTEPVKFEFIESLSDVKKEVYEKADVIVLNLSKFEPGTPVDAIEIVTNTSKPYQVLLLLFENYQAFNDAQSFISTLTLREGFVARPVFFHIAKPKVARGFIDNAVYGLLLGKVNIFGPSVKVINGCVEETLKEFIAAISPLPTRAAVVTDVGLNIIPVHSYDQEDFEVCYFSNRISTDRFLRSKDHGRSETLDLLEGKSQAKYQDTENNSSPSMSSNSTQLFTNSVDSETRVVYETPAETEAESENLLESKYRSFSKKSSQEFSSESMCGIGCRSQLISTHSEELDSASEGIETNC